MTDYQAERLVVTRAEARALDNKVMAFRYLAGFYGVFSDSDPSNVKLAELIDKMNRVLDGTLTSDALLHPDTEVKR